MLISAARSWHHMNCASVWAARMLDLLRVRHGGDHVPRIQPRPLKKRAAANSLEARSLPWLCSGLQMLQEPDLDVKEQNRHSQRAALSPSRCRWTLRRRCKRCHQTDLVRNGSCQATAAALESSEKLRVRGRPRPCVRNSRSRDVTCSQSKDVPAQPRDLWLLRLAPNAFPKLCRLC